jgi:hypothetical protein
VSEGLAGEVRGGAKGINHVHEALVGLLSGEQLILRSAVSIYEFVLK